MRSSASPATVDQFAPFSKDLSNGRFYRERLFDAR